MNTTARLPTAMPSWAGFSKTGSGRGRPRAPMWEAAFTPGPGTLSTATVTATGPWGCNQRPRSSACRAPRRRRPVPATAAATAAARPAPTPSRPLPDSEALATNGNRFWCGGTSVTVDGALVCRHYRVRHPDLHRMPSHPPARIVTPSGLTTASPAGRSWRRQRGAGSLPRSSLVASRSPQVLSR